MTNVVDFKNDKVMPSWSNNEFDGEYECVSVITGGKKRTCYIDGDNVTWGRYHYGSNNRNYSPTIIGKIVNRMKDKFVVSDAAFVEGKEELIIGKTLFTKTKEGFEAISIEDDLPGTVFLRKENWVKIK